jgi:hypothetical protein
MAIEGCAARLLALELLRRRIVSEHVKNHSVQTALKLHQLLFQSLGLSFGKRQP